MQALAVGAAHVEELDDGDVAARIAAHRVGGDAEDRLPVVRDGTAQGVLALALLGRLEGAEGLAQDGRVALQRIAHDGDDLGALRLTEGLRHGAPGEECAGRGQQEGPSHALLPAPASPVPRPDMGAHGPAWEAGRIAVATPQDARGGAAAQPPVPQPPARPAAWAADEHAVAARVEGVYGRALVRSFDKTGSGPAGRSAGEVSVRRMSTTTPGADRAHHGTGTPAAGPRRRRAAWLMAAAALLSGCSTVNSMFGGSSTPTAPLGSPGFVRGFLGGVVADEPRAALVAREILSAGGTAVDAAIASAFAMSVTLPSRAGLGGGGACLIYNARLREVITVSFPAGARSALPPGTDRPAALPLMARGLFLMHTRGGRLRFEQLIRPAEDLARFGTEVSAALADDLAVVAAPLLNDPQARRVFGARGGGPVRGGDRLIQLDLGATLAQMRSGGVGEFYQGPLSQRLEEASVTAGGGLTGPELREALAAGAGRGARAGRQRYRLLPAGHRRWRAPARLPLSRPCRVAARPSAVAACRARAPGC